MMSKFIIVGTAGRDKTKPMTEALWKWMVSDVYRRIPEGSHVISGGAAWADHLAISMFLFNGAGAITLHLPAPFANGKFVESGFKSAGATANYYHKLFSDAIRCDTLGQIQTVFDQLTPFKAVETIHITCEPASPGIGGMFARNAKVAAHADAHMLAYTFGEGDEPADGGTKNTWDKFLGQKTHISLPILI